MATVERTIVEDYYSLVKSMDTMENVFVAAFVWGKTGTGKTNFTGTFPKVFSLDTEGGLLTLKGKDVKGFTLTSDMDYYAQSMNMIMDAKMRRGPWEKDGPFGDRETFALDSLSMLSARLFDQIMEENKKDGRAAYGILLKRLTTLTSLLKELTEYGYHVVATAGETAKENALSKTLEPVPNISGSFRDFAPHLFDLSLWFESTTRNSKTEYYAYTHAEKGRAAKARFDLPHRVSNITFDDVMKSMKAA